MVKNYSEFVIQIQEYINEHFPNATIEQWEHEKKESLNFNVYEQNSMYILRVMDECLIDQPAEEFKALLETFNVAQVMRDLGDFPIVVTSSGCIFGSP